MGLANEVIGEQNRCEKESANTQFVRKLAKSEFGKCIGCILSVVIYDDKGCIIWIKITNMNMGR